MGGMKMPFRGTSEDEVTGLKATTMGVIGERSNCASSGKSSGDHRDTWRDDRRRQSGRGGLIGRSGLATRHIRNAIAAATADHIFAIAENEFACREGDFFRGPVDLTSAAIGDVRSTTDGKTGRESGTHIEIGVVIGGNGVAGERLAQFARVASAAGDDGVRIDGIRTERSGGTGANCWSRSAEERKRYCVGRRNR